MSRPISYKPVLRLCAVIFICALSMRAGMSEVITAPPGPPVPQTPSDGESFYPSQPVLSWLPTSPVSTWYHLWVNCNDSKFTEVWLQPTGLVWTTTSQAGGDREFLNQYPLVEWTPSTDLPSGTYKWWVQGWNQYGLGTWSAGSTFVVLKSTPGPTMLLSPTNGEMLLDPWPTLAWSETTPAATWYHLWVQRNGQKYVDLWTTNTSYMSATELPAGRYEWWVQPWNASGLGSWSDKGEFYYNVPGKPTVMSPNNAQVVNEQNLLYNWTVPDSQATWYQLKVTCDGKTFADTWLDSNSSLSSWPGVGMYLDKHRGGNYQWQVRGWSANGLGPWSDPGTFSKPVCAAAPVTPLAPVNGDRFTTSTLRYQWAADPCATYYRLCITRDGVIWYDQWYGIQDSSLILSGNTIAVDVNAHCSGNYQWWIQPWCIDGSADWASGGSFSVNVGSCINIGGSYNVVEQGSTWVWMEGESRVEDVSNSGILNVYQDGCSINLNSWTYGTISCDQVYLQEQPWIDPSDSNFALSKNVISFSGKVTQSGLVLYVTFSARGTYMGHPFESGGSSTLTFTPWSLFYDGYTASLRMRQERSLEATNVTPGMIESSPSP